MRISPLRLEWSSPGAKPLVVEKYFIQHALLEEHADDPVWTDARIDANEEGLPTLGHADELVRRLKETKHFSDRTELRVIKRIVTIVAEVAEE